MFWPIKMLSSKKIKAEIKDVKKKPLFETRCPYGEDEIIIKSNSSITADQIDKIVQVTDTSNIEIVVLDDI